VRDLFDQYCHVCGKLGVFGVGDRWYCREHYPGRERLGAPKSKAKAAVDAQTGMDRVADKTGEEWCDEALSFLQGFAERTHHDFLAEEAIAASDIPAPHDPRAWGPIFMRAKKAGWLEKVGYAPSASSNLSPKCLWRKADERRIRSEGRNQRHASDRNNLSGLQNGR
jgi:hypothetical protein